MSHNNKTKTIKMGTDDMNPYDILGISFDNATEQIITKAYRQLARKYHPDKQKQTQKQTQNNNNEDIKYKFHLIQLAKSFLVDDEYKKERIQYDKQLKSNIARKRHEEQYNQTISIKRKQMKEVLMKQEEILANKKKSRQSKYSSAAAAAAAAATTNDNGTTTMNTNTNTNTATKSKKTSMYDIHLEQLSKDGEKLREQYVNEQMKKQYQQELLNKKEKEKRQIRLKWSRKRIIDSNINLSSDDHIVIYVSSIFGNNMIESVEMIGNKGNTALITFHNTDTCNQVVQYYANSNVMRATYINHNDNHDNHDNHATNTTIPNHDPDWKIIRELEREQLLRHMEQNDDYDDNHNNNDYDDERKKEKYKNHHHNKSSTPTTMKLQRSFPPMIPIPNNTTTNTNNNNNNNITNSSLQLLEEQEDIILLNIYPSKILQEMKLVHHPTD